ncbi:hypothetical protein DSO57_1009003 [Entomophthora muscae]|uniref:Uncharacterized protein n=1 Tax=Entomophthora muscae TaxID=34485 RepID=A0ACC2UHV1_9FUNG|nr:hypothetical protein DSO57_1009003 [Entomophthora muscae]
MAQEGGRRGGAGLGSLGLDGLGLRAGGVLVAGVEAGGLRVMAAFVRIDNFPPLELQAQEQELNPEPGFPWARGL